MPIHPLRGVHPTLGANAFVASTAVVLGDVSLGDDSSVWFGAVVRGDVHRIRVGARTNIQDNAVLHVTRGRYATTVGDRVVIGHSVVLHGCTVGDDCLIGIGSVVLDGAVVGEGSLVAAGSLVTPKTAIPPRSFVIGRPGRVFRAVTDDERDAIRANAQEYVELAREYAAEGLASPGSFR